MVPWVFSVEDYQAVSVEPLTGAHNLKYLRKLMGSNLGRIVARGSIIEHWLNGTKVVEVDLSSDDFKERIKRSKFRNYQDYGMKKGRILLQDHGSQVWIRRVRIRRLPPKQMPNAP